MGTSSGFSNPNAPRAVGLDWNEAVQRLSLPSRGVGGGGAIPTIEDAPATAQIGPQAGAGPSVGTDAALDAPEAAPEAAGKPRRGLATSGAARAAKGANGEREVLAALRATMENVEEALRDTGVHVVGRSENVVRKRIEKKRSKEDIGGVPLVSIEVKRQENLNVKAAWEQTLRQADGGRLPVLCYKYNREPWRVRTWLAMTGPDCAIVRYVVAEIALPDFLAYYAEIYRRFLTEQAR